MVGVPPFSPTKMPTAALFPAPASIAHVPPIYSAFGPKSDPVQAVLTGLKGDGLLKDQLPPVILNSPLDPIKLPEALFIDAERLPAPDTDISKSVTAFAVISISQANQPTMSVPPPPSK